MSTYHDGRCECTGRCGGNGARRACHDPDLSGRCRAEKGQALPRSLTLAEVRIDPVSGLAFCRDCWLAYNTAPGKTARPDNYELFKGDEPM